MAEILHQLRLVVYPIIYRVLAPSQVVVWDFFHQQLGYVPAQPLRRRATLPCFLPGTQWWRSVVKWQQADHHLDHPARWHVGVSKNSGTPKWMVKIMENPIQMDDLWVFPGNSHVVTAIWPGGQWCHMVCIECLPQSLSPRWRGSDPNGAVKVKDPSRRPMLRDGMLRSAWYKPTPMCLTRQQSWSCRMNPEEFIISV